MYKPIVLLVVLTYFNQNLEAQKNQILDNQIDDVMTGGTITTIEMWPFMVRLRLNSSGEFFCAGAIVSINIVITAAHCLCTGKDCRPATDIQIIAASSSTKKSFEEEPETHLIKQIYIHPQYDKTTLAHDIALLLIKSTFKVTDKVSSINIDTVEHEHHVPLPGGLLLYFAGWGYNSATIRDSNIYLQFIRVSTISLSVCKQEYKNSQTPIGKWNFCTQPDPAMCTGNLGVPLLHKYRLLGISSRSDCSDTVPDIHTSVPFHLKWIQNHIKNNENEDQTKLGLLGFINQ